MSDDDDRLASMPGPKKSASFSDLLDLESLESEEQNKEDCGFLLPDLEWAVSPVSSDSRNRSSFNVVTDNAYPNQKSSALAEVSSSHSSKSTKPEGGRLGNGIAAHKLPTVAAANEVLV